MLPPFISDANDKHPTFIFSVIRSRNFLSRYAPDCTILSPKMQKLPTVGGGTPPSHTLPPRSLRSLGLGRFAPSRSRVPFSDFQMLASMLVPVTCFLNADWAGSTSKQFEILNRVHVQFSSVQFSNGLFQKRHDGQPVAENVYNNKNNYNIYSIQLLDI